MNNNYLKFSDRPNHLELMIKSVKKAYPIPIKSIGGIAVDIGANVGAFALVNYNKFMKIICIEPSKESVDKINNNLSDAEITNVVVYRYCVSDIDNKTLKLFSYKPNNYSGNATTMEMGDLYDYDNYEEVMSISLEDIFIKFNLKKINYLKVDCEFSEIPFLLNKDLSKIDYIGIEHHKSDDKRTQDLIKYLLEFFVMTKKISENEFQYTNKRILNK